MHPSLRRSLRLALAALLLFVAACGGPAAEDMAEAEALCAPLEPEVLQRVGPPHIVHMQNY